MFLHQQRKVHFFRKNSNKLLLGKDNFVYKRSLFREYPEEGDVVLPMNHYTEEDQSTVSNVFSTKSGKSKKTLGLNSSRMSKAISAHILKHKGL